jgi:diaminopimelate decarboxylase
MLGDYKFSEYAYGLIVNLSRPSLEQRQRTVYGPLCDPHDLWGYTHFGDELRKGDRIAVLQQGAYTFSTAWRFIKPIPPYIAFDRDGRFQIAHQRETFADRYAGCTF